MTQQTSTRYVDRQSFQKVRNITAFRRIFSINDVRAATAKAFLEFIGEHICPTYPIYSDASGTLKFSYPCNLHKRLEKSEITSPLKC